MDPKVMAVIDSEVEFAKMWDRMPREERPLKDSEKSVEFWLLHIGNYLDAARRGCTGTDKTPALEAVRKIAGLCVQCMTHHETPPRVVKS